MKQNVVLVMFSSYKTWCVVSPMFGYITHCTTKTKRCNKLYMSCNNGMLKCSVIISFNV